MRGARGTASGSRDRRAPRRSGGRDRADRQWDRRAGRGSSREPCGADDLVLDLRRLRRPVEVALDARAPGAALRLAERRIAKVAEELLGEPVDVGRRAADERAGLATAEHLRDAADIER